MTNPPVTYKPSPTTYSKDRGHQDKSTPEDTVLPIVSYRHAETLHFLLAAGLALTHIRERRNILYYIANEQLKICVAIHRVLIPLPPQQVLKLDRSPLLDDNC